MKGICFIEPLHEKTVKRIKVQTRRIISKEDYVNAKNVILSTTDSGQMAHFKSVGCSECFAGLVARYRIGDILYLKEPFYKWDDWDPEDGQYSYKFDNPDKIVPFWENKLFMPASAARHFIKITGVRAERLQDISGYDCIREGIEYKFPKATSMTQARIDYKSAEPALIKAYAALIDKINSKGTWDSNPFVWVYDYELIEKEAKV